jgi:hypothetical protein
MESCADIPARLEERILLGLMQNLNKPEVAASRPPPRTAVVLHKEVIQSEIVSNGRLAIPAISGPDSEEPVRFYQPTLAEQR